jgi:hypothetical protein
MWIAERMNSLLPQNRGFYYMYLLIDNALGLQLRHVLVILMHQIVVFYSVMHDI